MSDAPVRDAKGRLISGVLNPGGRPKTRAELRARCRRLTKELIKRLRELAQRADTDAASVAACKILLAYGYGAPDTKPMNDDDASRSRPGEGLTLEELRALARRELAMERERNGDAQH